MNWSLYVIGVLTLVFCQKDDTSSDRLRRYANWLNHFNPIGTIPLVNENEAVSTLNMPMDLTITTDSKSDRCIPSNGPYSYPIDSNLSVNNESGCPGRSHAKLCDHVKCSHRMLDRPFEEYQVPIEFVEYSGNESTASSNMSTCGVTVLEDKVIFNGVLNVDDQPYCNTKLPTVVLDTSNPNSTYTLSFDVRPDSEVNEQRGPTIFSVSGFSDSHKIIVNVTFSTQHGDLNYEAFNLEKHLYGGNATEIEGSYTLLVSGTEIVLLQNGQTSVRFQQAVTHEQQVTQLKICFGDHSFLGYINNIKLYNSTASTSEIYAKFTSQDPASHVLEPQCKCPREYGDSFNFLKIFGRGLVPDKLCSSIFSQLAKPYTTRYSGTSQGKWAIFTKEGWMSDFTNQAEILIKFNQPLMVYALAGAFPTYGSFVKRPQSMVVEVMTVDDIQGVQVLVSNNCTEEYGIPRSELPNFSSYSKLVYPRLSFISERTRKLFRKRNRKRSADGASSRRCYHWSDVWSKTTEVDESGNSKTYWMVIFVGQNDINGFFTDDLFGHVSVKLAGHDQGNETLKENWYSVSDLQFYARPHCEFLDATFNGFPTNISSYYNFHSPGAKGYKCHCHDGRTGDRCENCIGTSNFRYMPSPGRCASCDCLSLAVSTQCDKVTGQCDCGPGVNITLAGRRCFWHITDVFPLYGPIDGGTVVTISGPYLDRRNIETQISFQGLSLPIFHINSGKAITFTTTEKSSDLVKVDLNIYPQKLSNFEIGSFPRIYLFEFRPNPVIENILNPSTILSGGTDLVVTGSFFDSVVTPTFNIYILKDGSPYGMYMAHCVVISSNILHCPIPNLTMKYRTTVMETGSLEANSSLLNGAGGIEFTLGFIFDGHTRYRDMRSSSEISLRNMSMLDVYADPEVKKFTIGSGVDILNYSPVNDGSITIEGENLDSLFSADSYQVTIGLNGSCIVTSLTSTSLLCTPPSTLPEVNPNDFKTQNGRVAPNVKVIVGPLTFHVGYLYYETNFWNDDPQARNIFISFIVIVMVAITSVLAIVKYRRCRRKNSNQTDNIPLETLGEAYLTPVTGKFEDPSYLAKLSPDIQAYISQCRVPIHNIQLGIQIGKGHFGMVYKARLLTPSGRTVTVAAKTLNDRLCTDLNELEAFLTEATLMMNFRHRNVLSLIGVSLEEGERPLAILPYMENGDLCAFVRRKDLVLVVADLLHFGLQIANGMAYLAQERFVHRDLAARNCMVDVSYIVKVADFGMSRDVYETDYYAMDNMNKPLPMKWMAVESLKEGRFTSMSDVWSFGVTLWELLTRGCSPYPGMLNLDVKDLIFDGKRLDQPYGCPPAIYQLMLDCWKECAEERPTFSDIAKHVGKVLRGEEDKNWDYTRNATANISDDYEDKTDNYDIKEYHRVIPVPVPRKQVTLRKSGNQ